jgi:hypothetical protein
LSNTWFIYHLVCPTPGLFIIWFVQHLVYLSSGLSNTWFIQHLVYPTPGLSNIWFICQLFARVCTLRCEHATFVSCSLRCVATQTPFEVTQFCMLLPQSPVFCTLLDCRGVGLQRFHCTYVCT